MPRPEIIAEYRDALTDTVFTPTADAVNSDKCSLYHIDMPYVLEGCMQFIHLHLNCARGCKRQVDELDLRLKKDRQLRRVWVDNIVSTVRRFLRRHILIIKGIYIAQVRKGHKCARSPRAGSLIPFAISALYIIVCLFTSYASPLILFSSLLPYIISSLRPTYIFSFNNRPAPFPGRMS